MSMETIPTIEEQRDSVPVGEGEIAKEQFRNEAGDVTADPKKYDVTAGVKYDTGKPRMELVPYWPVYLIAKVFTFGAKKYADWNWALGMRWGRLYAAMQRHLGDWQSGEDNDADSGLPHLAHAGCCLFMLMVLIKMRPDLDDRLKWDETGRPLNATRGKEAS